MDSVSRTHILVVDDDPCVRAILHEVLEESGFFVTQAENGRLGYEATQIKIPDLVVVDMMMPEMNGLEFVQLLRAQPATVSLPIIMMTAESKLDDKQAGFDAGVDVYLLKPCGPQQLLGYVKSILMR